MTALVVLSEVAEIFNGKTPAKSDQRESGHPVLKIKDVSEDGKFKGKFESFVDIEFADKHSSKAVKLDDSLILNAAHNADYVGSKRYTAERPVEGSIATGEWLIVRADNVNLDSRYLSYWIASSETRFRMKLLVKGIHLYPKDVQRLKIPLPPLEEQKRIAAILDKADAIRRKRQQAIDLADQFLRSVFLDMFGDPVTNPKEWQKKKISDIGEVVTGNTPPRKESSYFGEFIEWIKSDNINTPFHYLTKAEEYLSEKGLGVSRSVPAGSILVTCIAGSKDCIGNIAIADRQVAFNQQINAISPFGGTNLLFIYAQLLFNKSLVQRASTESMKGMVSKSKFSEIELIIPNDDLQKKFTSVFINTLEWIGKSNVGLVKAENMFSSISQRAFNGELTSNKAA